MSNAAHRETCYLKKFNFRGERLERLEPLVKASHTGNIELFTL